MEWLNAISQPFDNYGHLRHIRINEFASNFQKKEIGLMGNIEIVKWWNNMPLRVAFCDIWGPYLLSHIKWQFWHTVVELGYIGTKA